MKQVFQRVFNVRLTLTGKIIGILSLVLLVTSSATALITYRLHTNIAEREISEQFSQRVEQVSARIDLRLQDVYRVADQIVFHNQVEHYLEQSNRDIPPDSGMRTELNATLNQFVFSVPNMIAMYLFDQKGGYFMPSNSSMNYEFGLNAYSQIEELLADSDGELVWLRGSTFGYKISYVNELTKNPVIVAARWLKGKDAQTNGVLVMVMNQSILANELNKVIRGNEGRVYLLDKQSNLLYTDENDPDKVSLPLLRSVSTRSANVKQVNNNPYLFAHAETAQTHFQLISSISMAEIRKESHIIPQVTLISALVSIVITGILVVFTTQRLLLPLKQLVRGMRRVEDGNLSARIRIHTNDELAFIGERFNSMLDYIDLLIIEGYEKQLREREAELTALQAQLNPHFLYNTLDTIHSRLYLQDDRETANLVINLSDMLRYALEPATTQTVLSAELEQVSNYLSLQKARFENNLYISVEADDNVLHCPIIRMLVQPLVENAFVHAFRDVTGRKELKLRAFRNEEFLEIEISDNGCGMSPDELRDATLPRSADQHLDAGPQRQKIGLRNVIRRIELVYGSPYHLEVKSDLGAGTVIRLLLPYHEAHDQESSHAKK
ncbi:cache domain-containing sensor histidine kinase [Paenibacillus eucommiae]|uniref:Two-component system sensor histidine kinase YesM n=1 Tax=Paenibacillus eucommiae TaxID=1355755 RepID=A0ABS4J286_9BACL|nr:sensor histidine kinase [Paenibacillus eucommiae]MBP1993954.1 two-component system sensor histidine kinase YesM [Paenibacillus eucommiae]